MQRNRGSHEPVPTPLTIRTHGPGSEPKASGAEPLPSVPAPELPAPVHPEIPGVLPSILSAHQLAAAGHYATAIHELEDVLRQLERIRSTSTGRSPANAGPVPEVLAKLRLTIREAPGWKRALVAAFLGGLHSGDLRKLSLNDCRIVVDELAGVLAQLERGS